MISNETRNLRNVTAKQVKYAHYVIINIMYFLILRYTSFTGNVRGASRSAVTFVVFRFIRVICNVPSFKTTLLYRLKNRAIAIGLLVLATVIYNEFSVYDIQKLKWSARECTECVKVLLVADPQILGEKNENYFGSWIARWDSDKYE